MEIPSQMVAPQHKVNETDILLCDARAEVLVCIKTEPNWFHHVPSIPERHDYDLEINFLDPGIVPCNM